MAETIDFHQTARHLLDTLRALAREPDVDTPEHAIALGDVTDHLRRVWNARGAADIAKLEATLMSAMGANASGPYIRNLDRALRTLDR